MAVWTSRGGQCEGGGGEVSKSFSPTVSIDTLQGSHAMLSPTAQADGTTAGFPPTDPLGLLDPLGSWDGWSESAAPLGALPAPAAAAAAAPAAAAAADPLEKRRAQNRAAMQRYRQRQRERQAEQQQQCEQLVRWCWRWCRGGLEELCCRSNQRCRAALATSLLTLV